MKSTRKNWTPKSRPQMHLSEGLDIFRFALWPYTKKLFVAGLQQRMVRRVKEPALKYSTFWGRSRCRMTLLERRFGDYVVSDKGQREPFARYRLQKYQRLCQGAKK